MLHVPKNMSAHPINIRRLFVEFNWNIYNEPLIDHVNLWVLSRVIPTTLWCLQYKVK